MMKSKRKQEESKEEILLNPLDTMKNTSGLEKSNEGAIAVRDSSGWVSCSHVS